MLPEKWATEAGGLSGKPLMNQSTQVVKQLANIFQGQIPIIAVGGIFSAEDALEKLVAGASLIQIYTGLIYQGPQLINDILLKI
jgi:dihydroorotate dehydrogenase